MAPTPATTNACTPKELELMAKVKALEDDRLKFVEIVRSKIKKFEKDLEVRDWLWWVTVYLLHHQNQDKNKENERLNERNKELEGILKDLSAFCGKGKNKSDDDDTLTRAKELLFEKTKICKKQELQVF